MQQVQKKREDSRGLDTKELERKKAFLKQQAIEKDRIFKSKVINLKTRIDALSSRINNEVSEREAESKHIEDTFSLLLDVNKQQVEEELEASRQVVRDDWMPPQSRRIQSWIENFEYFIHTAVPETIENQSGRVTRALIKSQESFEIDNTKLVRRERRIIERHHNDTIDSEKQLKELNRKRVSAFTQNEHEINEEERKSDFDEEAHHEKTFLRIFQVKQNKEGLADIREKNDSDILVAIEQTMANLQNTIISNFGNI